MASKEHGTSSSVGPSGSAAAMPDDLIPRVVVKFHDDVQLPYEDGVEKHFEQLHIGPWNELIRQFPGLTVKRLFTTLTPEEIGKLVDQATQRDQAYHPPNFLTYFAVEFPPGVDPEALATALATWDTVQRAYAEGRFEPLPAVNPSNDPRYPNQGYLCKAPKGIDAKYAWKHVAPGGAGEKIGFVDMEQGWTLNHEDLIAAGITELPGVNTRRFDHGTSVLGIVVAVDNTVGDVGIATYASARVISEFRPGGTHNRADAIMTAVSAMSPGDVLLLETQFSPASGAGPILPVEVLGAVFANIQLGTALGIVIIEPAGNGWQNLDNYTNTAGLHVLNRTSPDFQDSGAIMVAAAGFTAPHGPLLGITNFGSRIDCYAWGDNVDTLTTDGTGTATNQYTAFFNSTSSASAIIAGAALIVQSVAVARGNPRFTPAQLRTILGNPATGTASSNPVADHIGVMPNLREIL